MSGFNLKASETGHISDVLAKSAASANTSVEQLGGAMSYVAPVAAGAGLSLEETAAAVGVLSNAGIQGERAGTALRGMIASLQNPVGQTKEAIADLGLSMDAVNPSTHSLAEILQTLKKAGIDSSQAMQLVGTEAGPALLSLLNEGSSGLKSFTKELNNADGAGAKMAKTMSDNTAGKWKTFMSALESVSIMLFTLFQPAINAGITALTHLARAFGNILEPAIGKVQKATEALSALFHGDVVSFASILTNTFGQEKGLMLMRFFLRIKSGVDTAKQYLTDFKLFVQGLFAIFQGNAGGGASMLTRLGLSPAMVQQIINAINLIKVIINQFIQDSIQRFQLMSQFIIQAWSILWPYIQPLLLQIATFVGNILSQIAQFWQENGATIMAAVKNVFGFILSTIKFIMPAVMFIIQMVWTNIKGVIQGALNVIMGLIKVFAGLFTGDFSKMWEGIKQLFVGAIQFLWNYINLLMFGRILGAIKAFATKGVSLFQAFWPKIVNIFKNLDTHVWSIIRSMISKIIGGISKFIGNVRTSFNTMRAFGGEIFSSLSQAIRTTISNMVSGVKNRISSMVIGAKNYFQGLLSSARSKFSAIKDAIIHPISAAKDTVGSLIDKIKGFFRNFAVKIPLPHFSAGGSLNPKEWLKGNTPHLNVDWYAKGALFTKPTLFNTPGGLKGFGEAGPEAALPLTRRVLGTIGEKIAGLMSGPNQGGVLDILKNIGPLVLQVPLDGDVVATKTYKNIYELIQEDERNRKRAEGY